MKILWRAGVSPRQVCRFVPSRILRYCATVPRARPGASRQPICGGWWGIRVSQVAGADGAWAARPNGIISVPARASQQDSEPGHFYISTFGSHTLLVDNQFSGLLHSQSRADVFLTGWFRAGTDAPLRDLTAPFDHGRNSDETGGPAHGRFALDGSMPLSPPLARFDYKPLRQRPPGW